MRALIFVLLLHQAQSNEQQLFQYLLDKSDSAVRPTSNASLPIKVSLGISLTGIYELNVDKGYLGVNIWKEMEWSSDVLTWDPEEFHQIGHLVVPAKFFWVPDIVVFNNPFPREEHWSYEENRLVLYRGGTILMAPMDRVYGTCTSNTFLFPFDEHECSFKFGSWTYHGFQLSLTNRTDSVDVSNYVSSSEYELVDPKIVKRTVFYTCCPEPYPDLTMTLVLKRNSCVFVLRFLVPGLLLGLLNLAIFWIPPEAKERIFLGLATILAFLFLMFQINLTTSFPLIAIFYLTMMMLDGVTVILSTIVLRIYFHKGNPPPKWLASLCCLNSNKSENLEHHDAVECKSETERLLKLLVQLNEGKRKRNQAEEDWMSIAEMMDKFFFVAMLVVFVSALAVFICVSLLS